MYIIGYPLTSIVNIIDLMLMLYSFIVLAVCVLSFVNPDPNTPVVRILNQLTQPVFAYIRKYIPSRFGGFDLAALIVFVVIIFIRNGILPIFDTFAKGLIS